MFHKSIIALAAAAVVSACSTPSSPNAVPGSTLLSAEQAVGWFQQVCGANQNNTAGSRAALAASPFVFNPTEGRFFHRDLDLSFVVRDVSVDRSYCEMGWRSSDSTQANRAGVQGAVPGASVTFEANIQLLRAVLIAAV